MKKRSEIEEKFKWDLKKYFKNDDEFLKELNYLKTQINSLNIYRGKLKDDKTILECLTKSEELDIRFGVLYVYANLKTREDATNSFYNERLTLSENIMNKFSTETSFIDVEIKKLSNDKLKNLQKNKRFFNYFKDILRNKKHILSEKEEKLLSMSANMAGGFSDNFSMFDDADIKFPDIKDSDGKEHVLNHSNYIKNAQSKDRELRKNTFKTFNGEYGKFNNFLASNYINSIKKDVFYSRAEKYKNCLDKTIFLEEADRKVYDTLIKSVNENLPVFYKYFDVKRKSQKLDNFMVYDQFTLEKEIDYKYSYEEAIEIIKKATACLGEEYTSLIDRAVKEKWIDVLPNENKDTGAFSWGAYSKHPVVLTNFIGDTNSLFTLAHELGHCMHSYYSNNNQDYDKAGYTIFVAEVASIVNEMLLLKYLKNNTKNEMEKVFYYNHFLSEFKGTVFRQTMFAEFEQFAHESFENDQPISAQVLNDFYYSLNKRYFGSNVGLIDEVKYEWSRIPHFYNAFYVYKYAIGMISATYITENVIPNNPAKYLRFLKSGCTKPPVELLYDAGVDLKNKQTFNSAFGLAKQTIEEWEKLI